jgi:Domain of unknown function (DUF222)/HNH endonuclease
MLSLTMPRPAAALLTTLDALFELDLLALNGSEQADLLRVLGRAEAKISAVRMKVLAAAEKTGVGRSSGAAGTGQWVAQVTNRDQAATHREVGLATGLTERKATAKALADGALSPQHAEVIVRATRQLPDTVTEAQRDEVEADLVTKAMMLPPKALRRAARRALAAVEPDVRVVDAHENHLVADEEAAAREKTRLTLHDNDDGTVTGHFTVPTLQGHLLRKVLDTMTAPRRGHQGAGPAQVGDKASPRTDWDQMRGLAFCELLEHLPTDRLHPKTAATVVVTIAEEQLRGQLKAAGLDTGEVVSAGEARRMACNAGLLPAVLGGRSLPLDLGQQKRLFSEAQRMAVGLVHDTCAADGCERPFAWCELHHRKPWSQGGHTDLEDAVPLCHFHHQRIHDAGFLHRYLPDGGIRFRRRT